VAELGLASRGITPQGAYAVLNKTLMPAVIVEGAFFSNEKDLSLMMSSEYTRLYARGVAAGIIRALNSAAAE
jgi:N-acetylmuramoyl-L-alanine amidase